MNTQTEPKRTAQEIAEQHRADRKRYRASPEGKKASAESARLMAIAKAADEPAMMDWETIKALSIRNREQAQRAEIAETEAEQLKNRFGLPHSQADFSAGELYEIAQKNGYKAQVRAFYYALKKEGFAEGARMPNGAVEEFITMLLDKQKPRISPKP